MNTIQIREQIRQNASRFPFILCFLLLATASPVGTLAAAPALAQASTHDIAKQLKVGDIVFIHVGILPFRKIAHDTGSWVNHVGIVVDTSGAEPIVAESTFPLSKAGPLSKFVARSKDGRVEIRRLSMLLTPQQENSIRVAARKREGIFYDTGFNLHSHRQFCSRFVHEIIFDATGVSVGKVENLRELFADNPNADLLFWRVWYFGKIPWDRETVTPASVLNDTKLYTVFDGYILKGSTHA